jgi:hypothetical protein
MTMAHGEREEEGENRGGGSEAASVFSLLLFSTVFAVIPSVREESQPQRFTSHRDVSLGRKNKTKQTGIP